MEQRTAERRRKQQEDERALSQQQKDDSDEETERQSCCAAQRVKEAEVKVAEMRLKLAKEMEDKARSLEAEERERAKVHPIDILHRQIAADLISEREREIAEIDDQGCVDWVGKLDTYLEVERDAWREHAALERAGGPSAEQVAASSPDQISSHAEAVAMARRAMVEEQDRLLGQS